MAFLTEDGTGLATANSYVTVSAFKAYHKDRGNTLPSGTGSGDIQDALVKASDYIDRRYRGRFIGRRKNIDRSAAATTPAQRMEWPRYYARTRDGALIDSDSVPIELEEVTFEYAFRALSATLAPDPSTDDTNVPVIRKMEKVGPIETETEYAEGGLPAAFRTYPEADAILRGLLLPAGRAFR